MTRCRLSRPFVKFPFTSRASFSAHISTILSTIECRVIQSVPMVGYRSPVMRTGKSSLAESNGLIATGRSPAGQAISSAQDEFRKEILALLIQGISPINFDDLPDGYAFRSQHLSRVITQATYGGRILGVSENIVLPTRIQFTATANNLSFAGALRVRTLMVSLDAQMEDPGLRKFPEDPAAYVLENRKQIVMAALTIVRAYIVAGSPDQGLPQWGGFEPWSRLIRSAIVWAGEDDPALTREEVSEADVDRSAEEALYTEWFAEFGDREMLVYEVLSRAERAANEGLLNAILGIARDRNDSSRINGDYLGTRLRGLKGRIIAGLRLVAAVNPDGKPRKRGGSQLWKIELWASPGMDETPIAVDPESSSDPPAYTNGTTTSPTPVATASASAAAYDEAAELATARSALVTNILAASKARGIEFSVENGRLAIQGKDISPAQREQLGDYEAEIVARLEP